MQMKIKKQQQHPQIEQIVQSEKSIIKSLPSEYLSEYNEYFSNTKEILDDDSIGDILKRENILYHPKYQKCPFFITIGKTSKNYQIVCLNVNWGRFSQSFIIHNFSYPKRQKQFIMNYQQNQKSRIQQKKFGQKNIIIKIQYFQHHNQTKALVSMIKEIFIGRIASALGIGPIIGFYSGFDLLFYQNCIQFAMEKCFTLQQKSNSTDWQRQLKEALYLMHSLKIIHFDIKPQNIMFSPTVGKAVFIDFNLSDLVFTNPGEKIQVGFRGTINYCCPQLVYNFAAQSNFNLIDPYYNDIFCLKVSLKQIQKIQNLAHNILVEDFLYSVQIEDYYYEYIRLSIKNVLFFNRFELIYRHIQKGRQQQILQSLIDFLSQIDIDRDLRYLYYNLLSNKDSGFMQQIGRLINKKWIINRYINYLDYNNGYRQRYLNMMNNSIYEDNKNSIYNYLINYQKYIYSKILYFKIFIDYNSYLYNKYHINYIQREQISKICIGFIIRQNCINNIYQKVINNSNKRQKQLNIVIIIILQWIIKECEFQDKEINQILIKLTCRLMQYIFILDLGTLQDNIYWFKLLLQKMIYPEDKICLILTIKHLNVWNHNRINSKFDIPRYEVYNKLIQFSITNLRYLRNQDIKDDLKYFIDYAVISDINEMYYRDDFDNFHENTLLRQLVIQQNIQKYIYIQYYYENSLSRLYQMLRYKMQLTNIVDKMQYYYLYLFQRYQSRGKSNLYSYLYRIFHQNLLDQNLQKQFRIYYIKNIEQNITYLHTKQLFQFISKYLYKINDIDLLLNSNIIIRLQYLQSIYNLKDNLQDNIKYLDNINQIMRLKNILFDKIMRIYRYKLDMIINDYHHCFKIQIELILYDFILQFMRSRQQCKQILNNIIKIQYYQKCQKCCMIIKCFNIICYQTWIIYQYFQRQNEINIQSQLNREYELTCRQIGLIIENNHNIKNNGFLSKLYFHYRINFGFYCTIKKQYEYKYHGLSQLYFYLKGKKLLQSYDLFGVFFNHTQQNQFLLRYQQR